MSHFPESPNRRRRSLLGALGATLLAAPFAASRAASPESAWQSAFAPFDGPFNGRFAGTLSCPALPVEGRIPAGLAGSLYRNGPARMRLGATQYHHWFDGDGMVQEFRIEDGRIAHRGALLRTPKLIEEESAGRFLYPAFGTDLAGGLPVRRPDAINVANINLLPMNEGRSLYALWEGGSAVCIDPLTLDVKGFKTWSPETAGAPFCAHPRVEADGTVWAFGYTAGSAHLILYHISPGGSVIRQALVEMPQSDMVHDFAVSEHYLVFLLMPLVYDREGATGSSFASHFRWNAENPLIAALVDKSDLSIRRFELPTDGLFHIGNAWEERGIVRVGYASQPEIFGVIRGRGLSVPHRSGQHGETQWKEIEIDPHNSRARVVPTGLERIEFPRFDLRLTGRKSNLTVLLQRSDSMPNAVDGYDTVIAVRAHGTERYGYGQNWIAEEHVFVPDAKSARDEAGYIVGTAYDWRAERTAISIFRADRLGDGPIARVLLPYGLPLGLHGQFVART